MIYILLKSDSSKRQKEMEIVGIYKNIKDVEMISGTELTSSNDIEFWERKFLEQTNTQK